MPDIPANRARLRRELQRTRRCDHQMWSHPPSGSAGHIIPGPASDGTIFLGPLRYAAGRRVIEAIVPPGVTIDAGDRSGWRIIRWEYEAADEPTNLWQLPSSARSTVSLTVAHATAQAWMDGSQQDRRVAEEWLAGCAAHSLSTWRAIIGTRPDGELSHLVREAARRRTRLEAEVTELWGPGSAASDERGR